MRRFSDSSFGLRKKAKDSIEDPEIQAVENRAERDSSSKWTLVQLPFKIFHPVLQTLVLFIPPFLCSSLCFDVES